MVPPGDQSFHPAAWGGGIGGLMVGVVEGVRWILGR